MSVQLMKLKDSLELQEEEEVTLAPKNTSQFAKMKTEYTRQIDAMGKMLQATGERGRQGEREVKSVNTLLSSYASRPDET